ncbi:hypothetical protein [Paraburkholderia sp. MM6662-R1]|uniref:hypothetical protein n=1 Tax=Paraburkholderia sp. MM6662-R1 TaxID=2991066 RepID=UPI003D19F949
MTAGTKAGGARAPVRYFRQEGVPGRYFECEAYGTMCVAACARNFTAAPQLAKLGRLQRCIDCATGRRHAGLPAVGSPGVPAASAVVYRAACVRCRRDGQQAGTRLVGRFRLVRGRTLCVSCYNREREVLHGANAKGAPPKKWRGLFCTRASYLVPGRPGRRSVVVAYPHPVVDRVELALTLMREGHDRGIAWAPPEVIVDPACKRRVRQAARSR